MAIRRGMAIGQGKGYKNIISTSNNTNKIAVKKYFIENGILASPTASNPLSKASSFFAVFTFGPKA